MKRTSLAISILLFLAFSAPAQQVTGSITGTVGDSSGAAVPGVQVNLSNQETGFRRSAASDQDGNFRFLVVPPGNYSIDVSHQGFKGVRRDGIAVEADRSLAVPVVLEVGTVSEVVEVRAGTPLLEPNTSSLGTVMDSRKVEELPLNGRNPLGLANLIPTVRGIGFFGGQVLSSWRLAAVSIGGGPPLANGFLVDGIAAEKLTVGGTQTFLSIDSTQEFKVLTNAMSAEFGRTAGGIISIVSKSGTNEFHGNLFEFLRNDNLNANDFFSNKAGRARGALSYNQFGGTIGGPVKRNKLFFFFNYDAFRERRLSQATITSPTLLERSGDFSDTRTANGALIQVFDPTTTRAEGAGFIRSPFPGNRIPANRLDPVSRNVLTYYPQPNLPGAANTRAQNLFLQGAGPIDRDAATGKVDYNISDSQRISGRYTWDDLNWQFARLWGTPAEPDGRAVLIPRNSLSINYNASISPSLLLEARTGFNRENEHFFTPSEGFDITTLGMPEAFKRQTYVGKGADTGRFPYIDLRADASLFGAIASRGGPSNTILASAAITKISGAHTLKTGYEYRFYAANDYGREYSVGNYTFNRTFTQGPNPLQANANAGYTIASFLLGTPASAYARLQTDGTASVKYNALFVQDDWKVTRRLTLNLGLRWEHEAPPTDRYNVLTNFDPGIDSPLKVPGLALRGGLTFPGVGGASRSLTESSYKNFGPRFGFAYQANSKTVVRGGFGIMYIPITVSLQRTGYTLDTPFVASLDGGLTPQDRLSNPFPSGLTPPTGSSLGALTNVGATAAGQLRNVKRGYTEQWNFTVQHEPWNNWLVEAAWVGNHGVRLFGDMRNLNFLSDADFARGADLAQTVPNPFRGFIASGPLSGATITRAQSLMPHPQFTAVTGGYSFLNNSIYHALAVKVEKRFSAGFSVLVAYTAAKLLDDGTNSTQVRPGAAFVTVPQNWNNLRAERSKSPQDVPQRMVISALWALPFGKTGHALMRHAAGGWQLNAIQTIESGTPISLAATVAGGGNRPNVVPGVPAKLENPTIDRWFDQSAFSNPAGYTFGNVSRTLPNIHSDSLYNLDLSLFKNFHFREKMSLQFRAEAFNATNSPTFDTPGRTLNSATFGVVTATAFNPKPREIQLALRFLF